MKITLLTGLTQVSNIWITKSCHSRAGGNPGLLLIWILRSSRRMTKCVSTVLILVLIILFLYLPEKTQAAGLFLTNGYTQVAPASFRAAISHDGKVETIIESTTFNLNPLVVWNFVWLIPVPSKPQVEIVNDDFFNKIDYLTQKKFTKKSLWEKILYFDVIEENNLPQEPYSRPVNISQVEIFEPNNFQSLRNRLYEMGFFLPKSAKAAIEDYLAKNWYFIALTVDGVHIQMAASDSLTVYGAHTLPVKISFPTDKIIYPLKLASIQPDIDSVAIPLSFNYGLPSEIILGEMDKKVDETLAKPSANKYPSLPLDLSNLKIDLFIFNNDKSAIAGFQTGYADRIKSNLFEFNTSQGNSYFKLPKKDMYLTRLYTYKTAGQLEDLIIEKSNDNTRVNPQISAGENIFRILLAVILAGIILYKFRYGWPERGTPRQTSP